MANWTAPGFSKGQVNRAGQRLRDTDPDELFYPADWTETVQIVDNWRSSHGYPLQIIYLTLRDRARLVSRRTRTKGLVTQRRKRFDSIWRKLRLNPRMSLTQMQDVGGCRAVMRSMREVRALIASYERSIKANAPNKPELTERYNYIEGEPGPKPTGYRSMHYVFKYRGALPQRQCYAGMRVEIQIRTQLQHAWATAVEAVDALTKQALKSNAGDEAWHRFFALMGSVIAARERTPLVPNTPTNKRELYDELKHCALKLNVADVLTGYGTAVFQLIGPEHGAAAFLLELDPVAKTIRVTAFQRAQLLEADARYAEAERRLDREKGMQAVLVSAESVDSLRRAYPNYFLDTRAFLDALRRATAK
jgi:hypothetical protein